MQEDIEVTKPHRTLVISRRMLEKLGACEWGVACAVPHLPAKVSTNPEENIRLAIALDARRPLRGKFKGEDGRASGFVVWLYDKVMDSAPVYWTDRWGNSEREALPYYTEDPYQLAQALAHIADKLLTDRGK